MWAILLVIVGIVLTNNPAWFAGAATVGAFCLWIGIIIFVIWIIIFLLALVGFTSENKSARRRRR